MVIQDKEDEEDLDRRKALKVKVPVKQHIDLHTIKILTGKNMSETVTEAIALYIKTLKEEGEDIGEALSSTEG